MTTDAQTVKRARYEEAKATILAQFTPLHEIVRFLDQVFSLEEIYNFTLVDINFTEEEEGVESISFSVLGVHTTVNGDPLWTVTFVPAFGESPQQFEKLEGGLEEAFDADGIERTAPANIPMALVKDLYDNHDDWGYLAGASSADGFCHSIASPKGSVIVTVNAHTDDVISVLSR